MSEQQSQLDISPPESEPRFSRLQRAVAAVGAAAVLGGFGVVRALEQPTVIEEQTAILSDTGDEAERRMQERLAEADGSQNSYTPPHDETVFMPDYSEAETPTSEFMQYLPLAKPAPSRLIVDNHEDFTFNIPIVYTDVDAGISNEKNGSEPFNDPASNEEAESMAMDAVGLDHGSDLGPLLNEYIETGEQQVTAPELTVLSFVVHRSSNDPEAAGNPLVNNEDVDPATYGRGWQVGDTFKTRFQAANGQELDLEWTIVQHPDVVDADGNTIGEPTDNSPSWIVRKNPQDYQEYEAISQKIFAEGLDLPDDVKPVINGVIAKPSTSNKGNGEQPDNKPISGSIWSALFVAVPTGVETPAA